MRSRAGSPTTRPPAGTSATAPERGPQRPAASLSSHETAASEAGGGGDQMDDASASDDGSSMRPTDPTASRSREAPSRRSSRPPSMLARPSQRPVLRSRVRALLAGCGRGRGFVGPGEQGGMTADRAARAWRVNGAAQRIVVSADVAGHFLAGGTGRCWPDRPRRAAADVGARGRWPEYSSTCWAFDPARMPEAGAVRRRLRCPWDAPPHGVGHRDVR